MRTFLDAKVMAKTLRRTLGERGIALSHGACLDAVAAQFGFAGWNALAARLGEIRPEHARLAFPEGWTTTGPAIDGCTHRLGLDPGLPGAALIESLVPRGGDVDLTGKIAVLMQSVRADGFRRRRLRLAAELKSEDADCGTIWLRVDGVARSGIRFDNLLGRGGGGPLRGTGGWTALAVVLDVPAEADSVHYGFLLKGYGRVWARAFSLEAVGDEAAPTARHSLHLDAPSNLDFSRAL